MKVLFIGDIYSRPGREILAKTLPDLKQTYKPNLIIVNAENSANNGRGITEDYYNELMSMGVATITMGNHVWGQKQLLDFIDDAHICRPANFYEAPGKQYDLINYNGKSFLVMNLLGRTFMDANLENPFLVAQRILDEVKPDYSLIDFHAEATSEKIALGHFLDGKLTALVGTHTHIPTADERRLPKGTLYITDVGMTGPLDGIIGVDKDIVIKRFLNGYTRPNKVALTKNQLNAVIMDFEAMTIQRIHLEEK
ncbi:MAG: TIGR00282 family metallophosphoesterase [Acholeplasmataceae bacterium]|nr:TIGR00282 family metallophosphoesterase [Acholeplasmataceae bacterium]